MGKVLKWYVSASRKISNGLVDFRQPERPKSFCFPPFFDSINDKLAYIGCFCLKSIKKWVSNLVCVEYWCTFAPIITNTELIYEIRLHIRTCCTVGDG